MTSNRSASETTTATQRPVFFTVRALILTVAMLVLYTVVTRYPMGGDNVYATSYQSRIEFYSDRIDSLTPVSTWRQRLFLRHVGNFEIPIWISENRRPSDVIQLPPTQYAARYLQVDPTWTDPRIFTYFAGFQPIVAWADTTRRSTATAWVALDHGGAISLVRRDGAMDIDSLIGAYQASEVVGGLP